MKEFIDFVDSVLPSVDPNARDKAKEAILQFEKTGKKFNWFRYNILPELSQGDIISEIAFTYIDKCGDIYKYKAKGMVVSTSCHIDQKQFINIVPIFPLKKDRPEQLCKNMIYDFLYFNELDMKDYYVDFSKINTYDKSLIVNGINSSKIRRLFSLSQIGYYMFIVKLTVFLMRKEDSDTMKLRTEI